MSKLDATDVQGFVLRGYNMPCARYCFLHFETAEGARMLINQLLTTVTTGQVWDRGKPESTVNIAFTHKGLVALELPIATLISFPVEFQQGMRARGSILGDTGKNAPDHWDALWRDGQVHAWLAIHATSAPALNTRYAALKALIEKCRRSAASRHTGRCITCGRRKGNVEGALRLHGRLWKSGLLGRVPQYTARTRQTDAGWQLDSVGNGRVCY